jgi:hypothetical protein
VHGLWVDCRRNVQVGIADRGLDQRLVAAGDRRFEGRVAMLDKDDIWIMGRSPRGRARVLTEIKIAVAEHCHPTATMHHLRVWPTVMC